MLRGDLSEFRMYDVLGLLRRSSRPGALYVDGPGAGVVYCAGGDVTFATTAASSSLGDVLVAHRFLTQDDWEAASVAAEPRRAVADALAGRRVDGAKLAQTLQARTEEAVFELDLWRSGSFRFEAGVDHLLGDTFRFPIGMLLPAIAVRSRHWAALQAKLGSLDHVVSPAPGSDDDDTDLVLSRQQFRVLAAAARRPTIRELAAEQGRGLFATCDVLGQLLDHGMVTLTEPGAVVVGWDGPQAAYRPLPTRNGHTNGRTNGHVANGRNAIGQAANGHAADGHGGAGVLTAPPPVEFVAPGDAPARDLILRLLTAVKEL